MQLAFCWSPNSPVLLMNNPFMITRQLLRLVVYYLMPLVFISVFYTLIAKNLFKTKEFLHHSNSVTNCSTPMRLSLDDEPRSISSSPQIVSHRQCKRQMTFVSNTIEKKKPFRARHKVAKTVLFLCLVFFICWLPKQIHDLYW